MKCQKIGQLIFALSLCLLPRLCLAEFFRTDINPALLYWQAFAVMPDLSSEDQKYLFESEWRNRPMDDRAGELSTRFDSAFRLVRQASQAKVPCDWGIDLSAGPHALLPQLAKAKRVAQAATLRARWFVQHNQQESARDDLAAAFILGRNLSRDQVLISGLVQIAIENIVSGYVVQQWPELRPDIIGSILTKFDQAPVRGTMADCMRTEKVAFYDWFVRNLEELKAKYPADEEKALRAASDLLQGILVEENHKGPEFSRDVIAAAGKSMGGLIEYTHQLDPFYRELARAMTLPYAQFGPALQELQNRVAESTNLLLQEFFPTVARVRLKEFRIEARLAMVHAAYQVRVDPALIIPQAQDPFGSGPFEYTRFTLDGVDRGFKLRSQLKMPDFDEVLIFSEKSGPAFSIDGPKAGHKVP